MMSAVSSHTFESTLDVDVHSNTEKKWIGIAIGKTGWFLMIKNITYKHELVPIKRAIKNKPC